MELLFTKCCTIGQKSVQSGSLNFFTFTFPQDFYCEFPSDPRNNILLLSKLVIVICCFTNFELYWMLCCNANLDQGLLDFLDSMFWVWFEIEKITC